MGKCQSVNENKVNNSFQCNYFLSDTKENNKGENVNNDIKFECSTERLTHDIIMETQIEDDKIKKQNFNRKNKNNEKLIQERKEDKREKLNEEPEIIHKKRNYR